LPMLLWKASRRVLGTSGCGATKMEKCQGFRSSEKVSNKPDEPQRDDDEGRMASEKKESSGQKSEIERVQRNERTINSIGRQPRGKILSEFRDTSVDMNDNAKNDHWEKGCLQDDDGSELHDTASQKNMRARVTDRPELVDERSKKGNRSQSQNSRKHDYRTF
jgi:hypothetical protein